MITQATADVEVDRLFLVGRRILVAQQREVGHHPEAEGRQRHVPVEPPARVLLPEHQHQNRREEQDPARRAWPGLGVAVRPGAGNERQDDRDGDDQERAEEGGEPIARAVGVVDLARPGSRWEAVPSRASRSGGDSSISCLSRASGRKRKGACLFGACPLRFAQGVSARGRGYIASLVTVVTHL